MKVRPYFRNCQNPMPAGGFTISDLARDFGVTLRTLRFYESRGLIAPARSGMTRIYSGRDRARLALILKGKQLGFTLVEIRAMLANEDKKGDDRARNRPRSAACS